MMPTPQEPSPDARIDGLFELAFRRHQAGELAEAEQLYQSILDQDARQLDAMHFLGMIALQRGQPEEALARIGQALAANDRIAAYHAGIAEAYGALGRHDEALVHYRKAIEIEPGHWGALHRLAPLLLERGEANEALEYAKRALTWKDTEAGRALFVDCIRGATSFPNDPVFRTLLIRAITESWGPPAELAAAAATVIKSEPVVAQAIELARSSWPRRLSPQQCGHAVAALAADPLLHTLLNAVVVPDEALVRLLVSVRTILLDAAVNAQSDVSNHMILFSIALARQCAIAGYRLDVTDVERQALRFLRDNVTRALRSRSPIFAIHLIAVAAYAPLHTAATQQELNSRTWPEPLKALIDEHMAAARRS